MENNSELIVGSPKCPIPTVVSIIEKDLKLHFNENWVKFANWLDVDPVQIEKWKSDLSLDKIRLLELLNRLLEIWTSQRGESAKLIIIILILELNCGARNASESLRITFKVPTTVSDFISTEELVPILSQTLVMTSLRDMFHNSTLAEIRPALQNMFLNHLLGGIPKISPSRPTYYVGRKILRQNTISPQILNDCDSDYDEHMTPIFLFTGMQSHQLSQLLSDKIKDNSTNQIMNDKPTVKFVIFDSPDHFDKIGQLSKQPIHWLHLDEQNKLKWLKSRCGLRTMGMHLIQKHLEKEQEALNETEFISSVGSIQPICISDGPGTGKSTCLGEIGRKLTEAFPKRKVLHFRMIELVAGLKEKREDLKIMQKLLQHDSTDTEIDTELLLDGYDEVNNWDSSLVDEFFNLTKTAIKSARIWVTTRSDSAIGLEWTQDTIGHRLQPFNENDQVQFLTSCWTRYAGNYQLDHEKLTEVAHLWVNALITLAGNSRTKLDPLFGTPMHCLLIGEVFEGDAISYAKKENANQSPPTIQLKSITELYQSVIEKKLGKWTGSAKFHQLMNMHAGPSFKLLFTQSYKIHALEHLFIPVDLELLSEIGILEESSWKSGKNAKFIHRTFAEFFAAWFLVNGLRTPEYDSVSGRALAQFFAEEALGCSLPPMDWRNMSEFENDEVMSGRRSYDRTTFNNPIIGSFINGLISKLEVTPNLSQLLSAHFDQDNMGMLIYALAGQGHTGILQFLIRINAFERCPLTKFDNSMIYLAILKCNLEFINLAMDLYERHHEFDSEMQTEALRLASHRGFPEIINFFKGRQFKHVTNEDECA